MKVTKADLRLYAITDRQWLGGKDFYMVVEQVLKNGATFLQLREKNTTHEQRVEEAKKIKQIAAKYHVPFVVNDDIWAAKEAGADGVHIGQSDMPYSQVKRLLPEGKIIGLSVETREQVIEANEWDVTYIAASPVFSTATKTNTIVEWGLDGLQWIRSVSRHPLVAIGGIHPDNVASIFRAGADSVAVISAIIGADDPGKAARELICLIP